MSVIWAENFNIYGNGDTGAANSTRGFWNSMRLGIPPFETKGKVWCLMNGTSGSGYRRVLGATFTALGGAMRVHFQTLPPVNQADIIRHYNAGLTPTFRLNVTPDGNIAVVNTAGTVVATTIVPCIRVGTSHKIQYQMVYNAATGTCEVRVDGVAVLGGASGVNGANLALPNDVTSIGPYDDPGGATFDWFVDFMVPYSLTGTYNASWPNISGVAQLQLTGAPINNFPGRPLQLFGAGQLNVVNAQFVGGALDCGQSAAYDLGAGNYTLETFMRYDVAPTGTEVATVFAKWGTQANNRSYRLVQYGPGLNAGTLRFEISTDGTTGGIVTVWQTSVPYPFVRGRWYHIAVSRTASVTRVFINGVQVGLPVADANTYFAAGTNAKFSVGGTMSGTNSLIESGTSSTARFDECRITVGVGRYTANFAVPSAIFPRTLGGDPSFASVQLLFGFDNAVVDESTTAPKTLTLRGGASRDTPADASAAYLAANPIVPVDSRYIETPFLAATNIYQLSLNPANGETVTLGAKTYTFNTVLGAANSILIGANTLATLTNLTNAINGGTGIGVTYGTGTTPNATAFALPGPTAADMTAQAITNGVAGNTIISTDTAVNGAWLSGATLSGGADIPAASEYTFESLPPTATGLRALFVVDLSYVPSDNASLQKSLVVSGVAAAGTINPLGITPSLRGDVFEQDPSTAGALTPTSAVNGRIRLNRTA